MERIRADMERCVLALFHRNGLVVHGMERIWADMDRYLMAYGTDRGLYGLPFNTSSILAKNEYPLKNVVILLGNC